jgi:hypothetical protein
MDIKILLGKIATFILNPVIVLGFVVATIFLFYSIVQLIWGADGNDLPKKKEAVIWGVVGLFIMFSVYGIITVVLRTFNIPCEGLFFCSAR